MEYTPLSTIFITWGPRLYIRHHWSWIDPLIFLFIIFFKYSTYIFTQCENFPECYKYLGQFPYITLQWRHNEHDGVSNHQPHYCLLNRLFRWKKTSKLRVTGPCAGNPPVTGEFPAQRTSNVKNVFIWWRLHGILRHLISSSTGQWNSEKSCLISINI